MPWIPRIRSLFSNLMAGDRRDRAVDEELASYVDLLTDEKVREGLAPGEARRQALLELGGREVVKEKIRERRVGWGLDTLLRDVRFGLRLMSRKPGFTCIAVLTLALGIGATTAMFLVINGVLLQPFPYPRSSQLLAVSTRMGALGMGRGSLSRAEFLDLRERARSVEAVAAYMAGRVFLITEDGAEPLFSAFLSHEGLGLLGVAPFKGRFFTADEDHPEAPRVVVISHRLWRVRYAADPDLVGASIDIDGRPNTVVGIMPPRFFFPLKEQQYDLFLPLRLDPADRSSRGYHFLGAFTRPARGRSIEQTRAELATLGDRIRDEHPGTYAEMDFGLTTTPWLEYWTGDYRRGLVLLMSAVGLVLLISIANVANLVLMRSSSRRKELSVRMALGAGRGRIFRQLLVESTLLAVFAGAAGLAVALAGKRLLVGLYPGSLPRLSESQLDGQVGWFVWGLSILAGLMIGWLSAWRASRRGTLSPPGESTRGATEQSQFFQRGLVVAQVAAALILLICAGLVMQSFRNLHSRSTGFRAGDLLTFRLGLPTTGYPEDHQVMDFYQSLVDRLEATPGVSAASAAQTLPLRNGSRVGVYVGESPVVPPDREQFHGMSVILPGYFRTLGIPLLTGREFTVQDAADAPGVAIVNRSFADRYWPGEQAVGKRIRVFAADPDKEVPWLTVVGVVADSRDRGLAQDMLPMYFFPHRQTRMNTFNTRRSLAVMARTDSDPVGLVPRVRGILKEMDPGQPLLDVRTMQGVLEGSIADWRFSMWLVTTFTGLAIFLSAVGIYGVLSYSVVQRLREIGVRMALGARRAALFSSVLKQGMGLALLGLVIGTAGALGITRLLDSLLFEVGATHPGIFTAAAVLLLGIALLACTIPARRATRVDPLVALRAD